MTGQLWRPAPGVSRLLLLAALAVLQTSLPPAHAGLPPPRPDGSDNATRPSPSPGASMSPQSSGALPVIRLMVATTSSAQGPRALGINMGHRYPGSNWKLFFSRLKPSVGRIFMDTLSSKYGWTNGSRWGTDLNGLAVSDLPGFQRAVEMQRSDDGRNVTYPWPNATGWAMYEASFANNRSFLGNLNNTMYELNRLGVKPMVVIATTCNTFSFATMDTGNTTFWAERWELYRHVYVIATWCYKRGVRMFEVYNEPSQDLCLQDQGLGAFMQHYYLRAAAIRDAYEDLNAGATKVIEPYILVSAFARGMYGTDDGNWSHFAVMNRHSRFAPSGSGDSGDGSEGGGALNMNGYSYHSYDKTGSVMLNQFNSVKSLVTADWPEAGPIWVTEHNAHTGANWAKIPTTTDSAKEAATTAGQLISVASAGGNLILFKFSNTAFSNGVSKNGVHWADSSAAPYHVADASLTAEAARLVNTHLAAGPKDLLDLRADVVDPDKAYLAVQDGAMYHLLMSNSRTQLAAVLVVNASAWGIFPGTKVVVQEVSNTSWGEVSTFLVVDRLGTVTYTLPAFSVALLSFATGKQVTARIPAAAGASVAAGTLSAQTIQESSSGAESSSLGLMLCGTSPGPSQESTMVTLLRFDIPQEFGSAGGGSVDMSQLTSAVLEVSVSTAIAGRPGFKTDMVLSVLAVQDTAWTAGTATWQSIQALNPLRTPSLINSTASNFINWAAVWAVAGHISLPAAASTETVRRLDITDLVRSVAQQGRGSLSLLLYRPFRVDPAPAQLIPGDDLSGGGLVEISRKPAVQPQLVLLGGKQRSRRARRRQ